jgi:acetylornithine deacetylase/succinyl-diaminopimelate desuccinylase-like protein
MVYGHLDKQPYGTGWDEDLSPTDPVIKGELMYGRGASDDGYAPFSCMLGVKNAQLQGQKMPRICLVLETEEESGSPNLIALLKIAKDATGSPDYCFCLDSGAFNYEQLWITSSLRGICIIDMTVQIGINGYHSGEVGGVVPETFRVVRQLLDRLDDPVTGKPMSELETELPQWKKDEAEFMVNLAGDEMCKKYAIVEGGKYCSQDDLKEMYLNNTWRANLSITGADGLPPIAMAGNVVRASTSVRLSMRLPPKMDPAKAQAAIESKLTTDVPYGAKITLAGGHTGSGWCMNDLHPWLDASIKKAGTDFYDGKPSGSYGMGGSIPFLSELEKMYPQTQIVAFGLLGPNSNAHGPNEMINLTYAKKLTCALSHVMQAAAEN